MIAPTDRGEADAVDLNSDRLVALTLVGEVRPPTAQQVVDPTGTARLLPGSGGVVQNIAIGDLALGWRSDHLEPGATIALPEANANEALQAFSCIGNEATVVGGPMHGKRGAVFGKHGGILTMFAPHVLARLKPGDKVAIDAKGVGLKINDEPDIVFHSCSPELAQRIISPDQKGALRIPVAAVLPAEAAGAGIGMISRQFNIDIQVAEGESRRMASTLRFGDLVALPDQDHSVVRSPRVGWTAIGLVAHGQSVSGGHGIGFVTILTGPSDRFELWQDEDANLMSFLPDRYSFS